MVPDDVLPPTGPSSGLKAVERRPPAAEIFLAKTVPLDISVDPWWSLTCSVYVIVLIVFKGRILFAPSDSHLLKFWGLESLHNIYKVCLLYTSDAADE